MRAAICFLLATTVAVSARTVDVSMLRTSLPAGAPSFAKRVTDNSYNTTLALSRVYSAGIAYCPSSCINDCIVADSKPIAYLYNAPLDNAGYVTVMESGVLVSFRGTEPSQIANWIDDLDTVQIALPGCDGCQVHQGFYNSYLGLQQQLLDALNSVPDASSMNVQITGHSLGAAIAALAAYDLSTAFPIDVVYTMGQPRVGNAAFAAAYAATISAYRIVHYADVVPHLPLELMNFEHAPTEVWYQEDNTDYQVCDPSNGEDPNCCDSLDISISVSDHLNYLNVPLSDLCS